MDSKQGLVCLHNILVQAVSVTCLILATECLTENVACNSSASLLISLYHVNAFFFLLFLSFGVVIFNQMDIKCGHLSLYTGCPSECYPLFLSLISPLSLFLLPNNFNPRAPTLECMDLRQLEDWQKSPQNCGLRPYMNVLICACIWEVLNHAYHSA